MNKNSCQPQITEELEADAVIVFPQGGQECAVSVAHFMKSSTRGEYVPLISLLKHTGQFIRLANPSLKKRLVCFLNCTNFS
jgi:hypothetical protein